MEKYFFTKLSGAGNDFVLFDTRINPGLELNPLKIRKICDRRYGVGGDGILILSDSSGVAFNLLYYNADGSGGSLCGNGARCAIYYGNKSGRFGEELVNFSVNGIGYSGRVLEEKLVKFFLNPPESFTFGLKLKSRDYTMTASFVNIGSPHLIIALKDVLKDDFNRAFSKIEEVPVFELGSELRYLPEFSPAGTNVNFIEVKENIVYIRTYERGVENETYACGSGSVAAALVSNSIFNLEAPVSLYTKSGSKLTVDFKTGDNRFDNISLTGPAEITFNGELSI
jgi:diaminopimelate epimerase